MIRFKCGCGTYLKANQHYAGAKVKCPNCQKVVLVPRHEDWHDAILIDCPICRQLRMATDHAGQKVRCMACGRTIRIPVEAMPVMAEPPVLQMMPREHP